MDRKMEKLKLYPGVGVSRQLGITPEREQELDWIVNVIVNSKNYNTMAENLVAVTSLAKNLVEVVYLCSLTSFILAKMTDGKENGKRSN